MLFWLLGCGFIHTEGRPTVEAHRGGAGYWPENSAAAVEYALSEGLPAVEFDIVLTADGVPVINHDPWLNEVTCTTTAGETLGERVYIQELDYATLSAGYVCGGVADPEMPDASLAAAPLMTLAELLEKATVYPDVLLHHDVKYEPGLTPDPATMAEAILAVRADLGSPNPWYVTANLPEALAAFESAEADVETSLSWPYFAPDGSDVGTALANELTTLFGVEDPIAQAVDQGFDGLALPYQLISWPLVERAQAHGLKVQVWTVNSEALLDEYCRWPVDAVITDYPKDAPCLP